MKKDLTAQVVTDSVGRISERSPQTAVQRREPLSTVEHYLKVPDRSVGDGEGVFAEARKIVVRLVNSPSQDTSDRIALLDALKQFQNVLGPPYKFPLKTGDP